MGYKEDLQININNLDNEWIRQAPLYMDAVESSADANDEVSKSKQKLELVQAELDTEIRTDPDKFNIEGKLTEKAIASTISQHQDYKFAYKDYLDTKHEAAILAGAVVAFDHRKRALESLSKLWLGSYFSEPRKEKMDEDEQESRASRQRKSIKKKRKV